MGLVCDGALPPEERFKGAELALFDEKDQFVQTVTIAMSRKHRTSTASKFGICTINAIEKFRACTPRLRKTWRIWRMAVLSIGLDVYENDQLIGQIKGNPATRCT